MNFMNCVNFRCPIISQWNAVAAFVTPNECLLLSAGHGSLVLAEERVAVGAAVLGDLERVHAERDQAAPADQPESRSARLCELQCRYSSKHMMLQ